MLPIASFVLPTLKKFGCQSAARKEIFRQFTERETACGRRQRWRKHLKNFEFYGWEAFGGSGIDIAIKKFPRFSWNPLQERQVHLQSSKDDHGKGRNFIDYLMYALAGGAFAAITFSFLLWLQF